MKKRSFSSKVDIFSREILKGKEEKGKEEEEWKQTSDKTLLFLFLLSVSRLPFKRKGGGAQLRPVKNGGRGE